MLRMYLPALIGQIFSKIEFTLDIADRGALMETYKCDFCRYLSPARAHAMTSSA